MLHKNEVLAIKKTKGLVARIGQSSLVLWELLLRTGLVEVEEILWNV